jgi:hypothetical protein
VTCRDTTAARLVCQLLFPAGSSALAGSARTATFTLARRHHVYLRGKAVAHRGQLRFTLDPHHRLPAGRYVLTTVVHTSGKRPVVHTNTLNIKALR